MPVIKRYPNRKLYDTEAKTYVTLDEITEMIRAGRDVQVIDHETGDDLTTLTLSQIILEQEKKSAGFLPRSLLTSLIRT
ncbi:MAG: polyhydroxyalkanoate synthesis regulator DNA-binding domain-containing protein, partial [Caldilineaceae bacterium]|nr:polyhydroxyalkanoate synthesis regulator DNA-binding domain-containing protein [Caldilineaceae bacterium]